jgi:hypothetical protein
MWPSHEKGVCQEMIFKCGKLTDEGPTKNKTAEAPTKENELSRSHTVKSGREKHKRTILALITQASFLREKNNSLHLKKTSGKRHPIEK